MKELVKKKAFLLAVVFYLLGAFGYSLVEFIQSRNHSLNEINSKSLSAVSFAENLLHKKLGEQIIGEGELTPDEDFLVALELQDLAERISVIYIYSVIQRDNKILFTSANPLVEYYQNNNLISYEPVYLTEYADAPPAIFKAFSEELKQYAEYSDQWGRFRSLFFPLKHVSGETYVIGIDVDARDVSKIAYSSLIQSLVYGLLLGVIAFPLMYIALRAIRREYETKIEALYLHPVTGLPNKRRLQSVLSNNGNKDVNCHLLLIEVENFSKVSTAISMEKADRLMLQLAHSISDMHTEYFDLYQVYHCADDLFAVYSSYDLNPAQLSAMTSDIFSSLINRPSFGQDEEDIPLIIRMGAVSNYPDTFTLAYLSLLHAKQNNRSIVLYEPSLNLSTHAKQYIDVFALFTDALKHNRVKVFYQPILNTQTGQIEKYEALARITNEAGDIVSSPDEFMPIAYQSRLCHKLTRTMVNKVIEAIKGTDYIVSINLSVKDLFDKKTREYIIRQVRKAKVGHQIDLELLEQQVITNYKLAAAYIKQLKSSVRFVGMDDLGKHYSNFDRLLALPLDFIKIDGMIIETMERDDGARAIVEGIVKFADEKKIQIVAEHCCSASICELLREMKVDFLQGFYIGVPMDGFDTEFNKKYQLNG